MRQFTAFAAAIVLATTLSSVAAKADYHYGPVQNAGQCWKTTPKAGDFGYWTACPQPASATVARRARSNRQ